MVKIKRKEKGSYFKGVNGDNIRLELESKEKSIKISIFKPSYNTIIKVGITLLITVILNLVCLVTNILNLETVTSVFFITLLIFLKLCFMIQEENLVMVKGLGFQVTTRYILGIRTVFIPQEKVQNIFINEVIFRNKVIYVLTLLTKETYNKEILVPLFFGTLPRLACLHLIYKHIKGLESQNSRG